MTGAEPFVTAETVLRVARGQVGYDGTGTVDSPVSKYGAWYGINPGHWCAMFLSWCFDQAGAPLPIEKTAGPVQGFAYVPSGVAWFRRQGRYYPRGQAAPRPGDLAFFDYGMGRPSHVGIVDQVDGTQFTTIEGNTTGVVGGQARMGNTCRRKRHTTGESVLLGFGRPDFTHLAAASAAGKDDDDMSPADSEHLARIHQNTSRMNKALSAVARDSAESVIRVRAIQAAIADDATRADIDAAVAAGVAEISGKLDELLAEPADAPAAG